MTTLEIEHNVLDTNVDAVSLVKVLVDLSIKYEQDWPPVSGEWLWALPLGENIARLRNVPFYARGLAYDDEVSVRRVSEGESTWLQFERISRHSGHSTYRLWVFGTTTGSEFETYWKRLSDLGCTFEAANAQLVAIDMAPEVSVKAAYDILEDGASAGVWDFEEGFYSPPSS